MARYYYDDFRFERQPTVAEKRAKAEKLAQKKTKKGEALHPAVVKGTKLAASFWGQSWNRNLERYQDYENRLPRGRSYVRHGAVIDLRVEKGVIKAQVSGSHLYEVTISIKPLAPARWELLKQKCSGKIDSLIGLLQGKIPPSVMEAVTKEGEGLFPEPRDIRFSCSCPDYADLCKHASAAAYGVGTRLDEQPELLFLLRGVDHTDLIANASEAVAAQAESGTGGGLEDLSGIFGIELDDVSEAIAVPPAPKSKKTSTKKKRAPVASKKAAAKKAIPSKKKR